jgi:hypothetical protein
VVDRYVELNKIEALIPFFDDRAEQILPGVGQLVQQRLEEYGVLLEDDGKKTPIVLVGRGTDELKPLFVAHPAMQVVEFSTHESTQIQEELQGAEEDDLDDLLFGDFADFVDVADDKQERLVATKGIVQEKLSAVQMHPVIFWSEDWPIGEVTKVLEDAKVIFYLEDPSAYIATSTELYQWHLRNAECMVTLSADVPFFNAKQISANPFTVQQDLLAHIGAISIEQSMFEDINCTKVGAHFTDDTDLQMLRRWRFLD